MTVYALRPSVRFCFVSERNAYGHLKCTTVTLACLSVDLSPHVTNPVVPRDPSATSPTRLSCGSVDSAGA